MFFWEFQNNFEKNMKESLYAWFTSIRRKHNIKYAYFKTMKIEKDRCKQRRKISESFDILRRCLRHFY